MEYFKDWSVGDFLAFSAAARAQTGFMFIERCLDEYPQGTLRSESIGIPYSRQVDILISYNFELILDAGVFMNSSKLSEAEMLSEVKGIHSLENKWKKVVNLETKKILEIESIVQKKKDIFKYYSVTLNSGEIFHVEDHIDIRYDIRDSRGKETEFLRSNGSKGSAFDEITKLSKNIAHNIMRHIEEKYSK
jgi:hypothetical protein